MKNRNNDPAFKRILDKMFNHTEEVVRNTAEYIRKWVPPVYVVGEDVTPEISYLISGVKFAYQLAYKDLIPFSGVTLCNEIFLSRTLFHQNENFKVKELTHVISDDGYKTDPVIELQTITTIVHEVNHIINRQHVTGSHFRPTFEDYVVSFDAKSKYEQAQLRAKDEYHAYSSAQGVLYGMSDADIKKTLRRDALWGCAIDESSFTLDWNTTNER